MFWNVLTIFSLLVSSTQPLLAQEFSINEVLPDFAGWDWKKERVTQKKIKDLCSQTRRQFQAFQWKVDPCPKKGWKSEGYSRLGYPLIYKVFGSLKEDSDTTIIFSGVHPDELNPIPVAFRLASYLEKYPNVYKDRTIVIIPLVNPDGFFKKKPTRTNSFGVDLNRNFLTSDWYGNAHPAWRKRDARPRYYPGILPNSEPETLFQIKMIQKFQPQKILSLHAPLGIIDFDTADKQRMAKSREKIRDFASNIAKRAKDYRIIDFSVFPGSLGNFAGVENHIPTFTIELTDSDPSKFEHHWKRIKDGLIYASVSSLKLALREKD